MVTMFSRGDVVNVTIKGVRYVRHEPDGALTVQTNDPDEHLWALPPQAAIERVAPKEYPVQAGDIWTNPLGYEWVGKADGDLVGVDTGDRRTFDQVNKSSGPLTLVRRRGWSPEPAGGGQELAERDQEALTTERMLSHIADLVEGGLPCPLSISLNRPPRYPFPSVDIRMDDQDTTGVDAWARHLGAVAEASSLMETDGPWRSYGFYATFAGWQAHVWVRRDEPAEAAPDGDSEATS